MTSDTIQPVTKARKRVRMGSGPCEFKLMCMACGLNVTQAAAYLRLPVDYVQGMMRGAGCSPSVMVSLGGLYMRVRKGGHIDDALKGPIRMQQILKEWG